MKKTVTTIIVIIIVLLLVSLIFCGSSNINNIRKRFNDATSTSMTIPESTTAFKKTTTIKTTTKYVEVDVDSLLKNVKRENGKVNIYFFYGRGCPHCELEHEVFNEIKNEYGKYYNLYEFEIWYNNENRSLAHIFAENMNTELKGVPFTVIGDEYISGFGSETKNVLTEKIESQKNKKYDVYFDKIKER